ncbi:cyclin-dependent kinase-like 4 [Brachypodium distachyon]|nr:cyclin-dependent kinase-like 4 [Brachypodium distachyon]|eukprot:XP_010231199.3 cyclin-dependent kinase-like 4 [Brachypodium distachyon]
MAGAGGDKRVELLLQGFRSDGTATGEYRLVPPWEHHRLQPCVAVASVSEDATASLPTPPNPGGAPPVLEKLSLSMARGGDRVASFELVPVACAVDFHKLGCASHLTLRINPMEGRAIVRFYKNEGSSSRWASTWVYSMNAVYLEVTEITKDFGEDHLYFHGPASEDIPCPPMTISFQKNFSCDEEIGSGSEGQVYKCRSDFMGPKKFAVVKQVPDTFEYFKNPDLSCETSEVNILSMLNHDGIVQFYQAWTEKRTIYIGMKLCNKTLENYLKETSQVDLETRKSIFMQLTAAVEFMHRKGVVHRDIKPGNVLLDIEKDGLTVRLADFGISKRFAPHSDFPGDWYGSLPYRAPEIVNSSRRHNEKVDIFSIGMIYYGLFIPGMYKRKMKLDQLSEIIRKGIAKYDQKGLIFDLKDHLDGTDILEDWEGDYRILYPMIRSEPSERPSATQILDLLDLEKGLHFMKGVA